MTYSGSRALRTSLAIGVLVAMPGLASPQTLPPAPTTAVLTTVTVKADVDRGLLLKTLPDEVRHTVALYLEGKILQWYSRADGRGVVFVLNCRTAAEAKALTDDTPLAKAGLAGYDFVELSPLRPLGLLTGPGAPARSPQP